MMQSTLLSQQLYNTFEMSSYFKRTYFSSSDIPSLIFPGYVFLAIGGIHILMTNLLIGNFFDAFQLSVVTIYTAALDTSASTFLFVKVNSSRILSFGLSKSIAIVCLGMEGIMKVLNPSIESQMTVLEDAYRMSPLVQPLQFLHF
jgi:hypothetical protein